VANYDLSPLTSANNCTMGKGLAIAGIQGPVVPDGSPFRICVSCAANYCEDCVANTATYTGTGLNQISYTTCNKCAEGFFANPPSADPSNPTIPCLVSSKPVQNECSVCQTVLYHCSKCGPFTRNNGVPSILYGMLTTLASRSVTKCTGNTIQNSVQCTACGKGYVVVPYNASSTATSASTKVINGVTIVNQCVSCSQAIANCDECYNDPRNGLPICAQCSYGFTNSTILYPGSPSAGNPPIWPVLTKCLPASSSSHLSYSLNNYQ